MFGSLISAMVTPFDDKGMIDYSCVSKLIQQTEKTGHSSIVIGGSTGEGHALSFKEKRELLKYVKNQTKLAIIYTISSNSLAPIKEEMKAIDKENPDGYLISVPYYNLPPQRGIYLFFKEISTYTTKPIIIYNVPKRTGSHISFMTIRKLIKKCPNIKGIKEASSDMNLMRLLKKNFPDFLCYCGNDSCYYEALQNGADGIISVMSILYGNEMKELYQDFKEGYHHVLLDNYLCLVSELLSLETNPIPIKYLLSRKGYPSMNLRLPLVPLSSEYLSQINLLL